jgi:diguanylate cyclase (GGDEF)-like protein/PAS domain S-box-containing protein
LGAGGGLSEQTQTIDLNSLFATNLTESGSFHVGTVRKTTFAKLLDALPMPAALLHADNTILFGNQSFVRIYPDRNQWSATDFSQLFIRPVDRETCEDHLSVIRLNRKPRVMEAFLGTREAPIWGRAHLRSVRLGDERLILVLVEDLTAEKTKAVLSRKVAQSLKKARDDLDERVRERTSELSKANEVLKKEIIDRKRVQTRLNLAAKVISSCNEAILVTDTRGRIVYVNAAFTKITGYSKAEVIGRNPSVMASGRHPKEFWAEFWRSLTQKGHWRGEVWDRRKDGEVFPKLLAVSAIADEKNKVTHYVGIFSDITLIKQSEERLENLAHYDPLTQLPNRLLFRDRLNQALIRSGRENTKAALMFLDLDGFKTLNDTVGHAKGDELLVAVASRLQDCVRRSDTTARIGGDEFTVVMPDVDDMRQVVPVAQRIIQALSRPFNLSGDDVFSSVSIGIAMYPRDGRDADTLLKHADTAMYHAKSQGKNNFQFFSKAMNAELTRLSGLERDLRRAIESDGLALHYQPIVDSYTGGILGAEALLRMRSENGSIVSAGPYVAIAEERGLIVPIGEWVLRETCRRLVNWAEEGHSDLRVAVNVSMRQLREHDLVRRFMSVIEESGVDPQCIELELTESSIMENPMLAVKTLSEFRRNGLSITIDDFGAGYSSLSRLRKLPVDKLKIDKSFMVGLPEDRSQAALVQAMVTVAHSLDMKVVAEGVESGEQAKILGELGCDSLQGFYFSQALSCDYFQQVLARGGFAHFFDRPRPSGIPAPFPGDSRDPVPGAFIDKPARRLEN